jgi:predicted transcriptional regulator
VNTSRDAARSVAPFVNKLQDRVLTHIKRMEPHGATSDQLEEILGLAHQTVSARVRELYTQGWIYRTKRTRSTRSGRHAVVYRARREQKSGVLCTCDHPTCSREPCKMLREYRITHRIISEIVKTHSIKSPRGLLDHIECECEILSK